MRSIIAFAIAAIVAGALVPRLFDFDRAAPVARATVVQPAPEPQASGSTTLRRGSNGHFQTAAVVDGRRLEFLVDTGASAVVLRESDAARLGIRPMSSDYTATASTANGVIKAAPVELRQVEVGDIKVFSVAAFVLPDKALSQNLLGMSFLGKVRWEHRNGTLVLER